MRDLRRRCARRLRGVTVPRPFNLAAFCDGLGTLRGRPVRLLPADLPPLGPSGLWIAAATADYIFYERTTTRLHQEHIVLHEVGHLLSEHQGAESAAPVRELFPHLDPAALQTVLARTRYSTPEECEAEMIASLIHERIDRRPISGRDLDVGTVAALTRLEATLDSSRVR